MVGEVLLDTDVIVEYLRGRPETTEYLEGLTSGLYISVITVAELFAGIKGEEEKRALDSFLLAYTMLPVTEEVARLGGAYRRDFKPSHGTGLADALIAATAEQHSAELVTFNRRHFPMLADVTVPYER